MCQPRVRLQLQVPVIDRESFIHPVQVLQKTGIGEQDHPILVVQRECTLKAPLRRLVVELEPVLHLAQRGVRVRQRMVEMQRLERRRLRLRHGFERSPSVQPCHSDQGVREAGVRQGILRIEPDGGTERLLRLARACAFTNAQMVLSEEVSFPCLDADGVLAANRFAHARCQLHL